MVQIEDALTGAADQVVDRLPEFIAAGVTLLVAVAVGRVVALGVTRLLGKNEKPSGNLLLVRRLIHWAFTLFGIVIALQILGLTGIATSILATGGFLAVVLGFAFREVGENLLAGLFLSFSRSFDVGDLIESSGHRGRVTDIQLRHVHIRSADGRDIFIPSSEIFSNVLVNFTRDGLRRGGFVVGLDYGEDCPRARDRMLEIVREVHGVLEVPPPRVRVSEFTAQYMELEILFWIDTDRGGDLDEIRSGAMEACVAALKADGVKLSSDVSSAVALDRVDVSLDPPRE